MSMFGLGKKKKTETVQLPQESNISETSSKSFPFLSYSDPTGQMTYNAGLGPQGGYQFNESQPISDLRKGIYSSLNQSIQNSQPGRSIEFEGPESLAIRGQLDNISNISAAKALSQLQDRIVSRGLTGSSFDAYKQAEMANNLASTRASNALQAYDAALKGRQSNVTTNAQNMSAIQALASLLPQNNPYNYIALGTQAPTTTSNSSMKGFTTQQAANQKKGVDWGQMAQLAATIAMA